MRIGLFGGWSVEHDGAPVEVKGERQRGLLFRLALDPGTVVTYRALAEDLWPDDLPENPKASLQSLVARLRPQLPGGILESAPGGYRLNIGRDDVDVVRFSDLVAQGRNAEALDLWTGEPWSPGDGYDWFARDLAADRAAALAQRDAPAEVPAPVTGLVGRADELVAIQDALSRSRLVTLLGPGGAGKTRLALEAVRGNPGARLVELAPVGSHEVWNAIQNAVGREVRGIASDAPPPTTPLERLVAALGGSDLLLVLDNCEHVVEAAAEAAAELLAALPRLRILATSREPLGILGEAFVAIGPLAPADAERLFAERVRDARGTAPTDEEAVTASRIRDRLDGLPLALELAAARTRTLSLDELADGLDDRFALLARGPRTADPRHQTLRSLVDWSWDLLDESERRMLEVAALYPAGIAAEDAATVAGAHGGEWATFEALVDKSLLYRSGGRFRALETIREYAAERLAASGRESAERGTRLRVLADAAAIHDARLRTAETFEAIAWFDAEDDNIAAAIRDGVEHGDPEQLVRLAAATTWYWIIRDRNDVATGWIMAIAPIARTLESDAAILMQVAGVMVEHFGMLEDRPADNEDQLRTIIDDVQGIAARASEHPGDLLEVLPVIVGSLMTDRFALAIPADDELDVGPWPRAMLAALRAAMAQNRGAVDELGASSELALRLFRANGDRWGLALAMQMRAEWLSLTGRLEEALTMMDDSSAIMARITSLWDLQQQEGAGVGILVRLGRLDEAAERSERLLARARASASDRALSMALLTESMVRLCLGDVDGAAAVVDELDAAIAGWPEPPTQLTALVAHSRGAVARLRGDFDGAAQLLRAAAADSVASGDHPIAAMVAVGIGLLAVDRGSLDDARRALQIAVDFRGTPDPRDPAEAELRAALGLDGASPTPAIAAGAGLDKDDAAAQLDQILRR